MSSYKNVNTDYTLTCNVGAGLFTIDASCDILGNLTVQGNTVFVIPATTDSPFLTVAANNTGTVTDGGLLMRTGQTTYAGLRFDTLVNAWQTSNSVTSFGDPVTPYANIGNTAAGANTQIQFNYNNGFAASPNFTFDEAINQLALTGDITVDGYQVYGNTNSTPANVANSVVVYSNSVGGGGTGLYVTSAAANDELVSNYKAIIYGIIF
jgi:hypothetical protein